MNKTKIKGENMKSSKSIFLITLIIFIFSLNAHSLTVHNGKIWNIIGINIGSWNLVDNVSVSSPGPNSSKDMKNLNPTGNPYYFSCGWESLNNTLFVIDNTFDYANTFKQSIIRSAYLAGSPSNTIDSVNIGDIIIAKIRGNDEYMAIKITNIGLTTSDNLDFIEFEYKKEYCQIDNINILNNDGLICCGPNFTSCLSCQIDPYYLLENPTFTWQPASYIDDPSSPNPQICFSNISTYYDTTTFKITITSDNCGMFIDSLILITVPFPEFSFQSNPLYYCPETSTSIIVNAFGGTVPYIYSLGIQLDSIQWLTNQSDSIFNLNPSHSIDYIVSVSDSNSCSSFETISVIEYLPFNNEQICLVTVDTTTWKNKIMWEKTANVGTESFNVYKEVSTNIYNLIGSIPYDNDTYFIDITSAPESHGDKYKITVIDTCGNESSKSNFHKTMNLVISTFGSTMGLSWTPYEDESGVFIPSVYYIYRGTQPNNIQLFDSISASFTSYNDNNVFNQFYYMVGVKKTNGCNVGTKANYSTSFSNKKQNSVGINENNYDININIFPNPKNEKFRIEIEEKAILEIIDSQGQILETRLLMVKENNIDISKLSDGVYTLRIITDNGIAIRKLIKE